MRFIAVELQMIANFYCCFDPYYFTITDVIYSGSSSSANSSASTSVDARYEDSLVGTKVAPYCVTCCYTNRYSGFADSVAWERSSIAFTTITDQECSGAAADSIGSAGIVVAHDPCS